LEYKLNITNKKKKQKKLFVKLKSNLLRRIAEYNIIPTIKLGFISLTRRIEEINNLFQKENRYYSSEIKKITT
jgi:hypothetical protein